MVAHRASRLTGRRGDDLLVGVVMIGRGMAILVRSGTGSPLLGR
jgi:hypothetical protein